ncbi:hypothetical protein PKOR_17520 [Pontibacter korlensis]|uniref:STAS/SEC14 domain-containing protein n=1 Tax=Pontibacter korlensis TaxID=400092 RepID=A0A0E3UZ80_9BACT|nr:hypothetical protein [Pontibacter korlensis]AKD05792.1 hypothetical protein PKOR_17520 [Pontibacter korlensis]
MNVYKSVSLEVSTGESHRRLLLRCRAKLNSIEFREGVVEALQHAEAHQIKQWLLDLREIGELDEEEEEWLQRYLFPCLMSKLGTGNYVAMVLSNRCYRNMEEQSGSFGLESYNEMVIIKVFCHLVDAESWLDGKEASQAS